MRSGAAAVQNTLTPPAQTVLRHAISIAHERGHAQVQPLHVALMLLVHGGPLLRQACADSHTQSSHGLQQCRALELCFNVALDRLPQSSTSSSSVHPLGLSNALIAALKRAQAHQKRGCPEQQQPPLLAVKVEIERLIISILEDPSVSRVMKEAGFQSKQVKTNLENAIGLSGSMHPANATHKSFASAGAFGIQPMTSLEHPQLLAQDRGLVGCMGARPLMPPLARVTQDNTEDRKLACCSECMSHLNAECEQIYAQESARVLSDRSPGSAEVEGAASPLPSWLQKEKDIKSEQEKSHSLSQKLQELHRKWQLVCRTSHLERHNNTVSAPARDTTLSLLPHSWVNADIPSNRDTLGPMVASSAPPKSVDITVPLIPKPSRPSHLPHWARNLSSGAVPDGPLASNNSIIGPKVPVMENVETQVSSPGICRSSLNEESRAASLTEESHEKTEVLQPQGFGSPVTIGSLGWPRPTPSPLAKPRASSVGGCPLRGRAPQGQSPLSALKSGKIMSKSPLAGSSPLARNSPLRPAQKLPPKPLDVPARNQQPLMFNQKAAERLKHVYKGLMEKVSWQGKAIATIATTVVNAHSGMGKLRGLAAKADTWLLLLGPDRVGKRLIADALGELVFDKKPICFGLIQQGKDLAFSWWGREDQEIGGARYRGRTALDSVVDALRTNPLSVLLLEDIDRADSVLRMNLIRAMETGKLTDSSDRQVSVGNAIIIMTSKVGTDSIPGITKGNPFCEEKLASLSGARMTLLLEPPRKKEVVFRGGQNIHVVKDSVSAPVADKPVNLTGNGMFLKRKPNGFLNRALSMHRDNKRAKVVSPSGRTVPLDLNLSAEENEAVLTDTVVCQEEDAGSSGDSTVDESNACISDPVLSAVQEALSVSFCTLVDNAVVFEPFDMMGQANWVLSQLSSASSGLIPKVCTRIEVDFQLLEHMVATVWRTSGGNQAFATWVQEKLKCSLTTFMAHSSVVEDKVLRFAYAGHFSKELCSHSELPLQIEVGSS